MIFILSRRTQCLLLLGDTNGFSLVSSGLSVLAASSETPVVTQTTVSTDFLQTLQILTDLVVQDVGHHLVGLTVLVIPLSVEEPIRDLVLAWVLKNNVIKIKKISVSDLHDGDDLFDILLAKLSSPLRHGDVSLLQYNVSVPELGELEIFKLKDNHTPATNTFDRGQGEHNIGLSLNVSIQDTENMLKVGRHHQRHGEVLLLSETVQDVKRTCHRSFQQVYSFSSERILALGLVTRMASWAALSIRVFLFLAETPRAISAA